MSQNPAIANLLEALMPGRAENMAASRCVSCKRPVNIVDLARIDAEEFRISGICPQCYSEMMEAFEAFDEDEEGDEPFSGYAS